MTAKCCWCGALFKRDRERWEDCNIPANVQAEIDALIDSDE